MFFYPTVLRSAAPFIFLPQEETTSSSTGARRINPRFAGTVCWTLSLCSLVLGEWLVRSVKVRQLSTFTSLDFHRCALSGAASVECSRTCRSSFLISSSRSPEAQLLLKRFRWGASSFFGDTGTRPCLKQVLGARDPPGKMPSISLPTRFFLRVETQPCQPAPSRIFVTADLLTRPEVPSPQVGRMVGAPDLGPY